MTTPKDDAALVLGISGFTYRDLHTPPGLARLHATFLNSLAGADATLAERFAAYRTGSTLGAPAVSDLLIEVGAHVSAFIGKLFGVEKELADLAAAIDADRPVFRFKQDFLVKRALKKGVTPPSAETLPALAGAARSVLTAGFHTHDHDAERALASAIVALLDEERALNSATQNAATDSAIVARFFERVRRLSAAAIGDSLVPIISAALAADAQSTTVDAAACARGLAYARELLALFERWNAGRARSPEVKHWPSFRLPLAVDQNHLVELERPDAALAEVMEGPTHHRRRRDGFALTDGRASPREVQSEVEYCLYCHKTQKDSCSHGFVEKTGGFKKNALGIALAGCPLEERISEAHALRERGDVLGALAMVTLDNPMLPGTGHRICNDCMKGCIFQKQEPVNIPQIETAILTDILKLPWGFEIYTLLTRFNPLNINRPHAAPYNGKNVLIVGQGPAGYTLAQWLLNEGFGVVGIDGLKIEPIAPALAGPGFAPIRHVDAITQELNKRTLAGFGGVAEYGITVRWDKRFLDLLHLTLRRRDTFRLYGGTRFGGTITVDDAWKMGFDHIAIAAGAGKPTLVDMKNNLARGIRQASDFLMALQLTGAFKDDALACLEVKLPAIVIGGGLTAIDTATEIAAYYPVQVEKILTRHEVLCAEQGEDAVVSNLDAEERETLEMFVAHGRAVREERQRAAAAHEAPDFAKLVRAWGGVSLVYRKSLNDSPAYRLNHEEVAKFFEEGIRFIERLSPTEARVDARGAVSALVFERQTQTGDSAAAPVAAARHAQARVMEGQWTASGEFVELPARTVCVAAGTSPNVTYNREKSGTFELAARGGFFKPHRVVRGENGVKLEAAPDGFFTSYLKDGRTVSYFGDNHPVYAGSVVKAMASAKDGYPYICALFEDELKKNAPSEQSVRDTQWTIFTTRLELGLKATVHAVSRLTSTIVEVVIHAPLAAQKFEPGQFYRLQNFEAHAPRVDGIPLLMEGLALTGAWTDPARGLLALIVLEMGASSRLCAALKPGEPVVVMGPTGAPSEIPRGEDVLLAGGGLGNAVLFSISRALRAAGSRVIYFAGYRSAADLFKQDDIEAVTDQVVWAVDSGTPITPRRPQDRAFVGNIVQAMVAYGTGALGPALVPLSGVKHLLAIGSDRMMAAVQAARHGVLAPLLNPAHVGVASINSPMQCMMKEICAQCLQRHVGPDGKEVFVFSCFNQDQPIDRVDFAFLRNRLKANALSEKLADRWTKRLLERGRIDRV